MDRLLKGSKMFLKRNSSTILTCIGGVGVVATAVLAVKATPKALLLLEDAKEEKGEELTKTEIVKVAGPVYIPAVATGAGTLACIFGANMLNKRSQASLMSAYALLDKNYRDYRDKVKELHGPDAARTVINEIAKDTYKEEEPEVEDSNNQLFYDSFSGTYFESTLEEVLQAEYKLNRLLITQDYAYLNDWYLALGIEPIDESLEYGWTTGACSDLYWQSWIDFHHQNITMDDGLEVCIIHFNQEPILCFENYI